MTPDRDPRIDPQVGDEVSGINEDGYELRREVLDRIGDRILYFAEFQTHEEENPEHYCSLATWKKWCCENDATVNKVGASPKGGR